MDPNLLKTLTYIGSAFSLIITCILIFLIARHKPRKTSNMFLIGWMIFSILLVPPFGSLIMATNNPKIALYLYRMLSSACGLLSFFYLFVQGFLEGESKKQFRTPIISYAVFIFALNLIKPDIFISGVEWSETVEFYLLKLNPVGLILSFPVFLFYALAIYKLLEYYRKSHSIIEKNRLKYLLLGAIAPSVGFILILIPPFSGYPFDLLGITISGILLTYGILKYKLMDISVIIKKGLLYSILTTVVTGTYLGFSLLIQLLLHKTETPFSLPTLISTALVIALVFQPLQINTQRFIDRIFFRRKYDPQKLVSSLTEIFSKNLDLNFLSSELINQVCQTLQIERAVFFLADEKTNRLKIQKQKNIENLSPDFTITMDSPFIQFLLKSQGPQLNTKEIPIEHLDNLSLELFVPLKNKDRLLGILALGPKLSNDYYSLEELDLLNTIAKSATLALENAFMFSEMQESKDILEVKVKARTNELEELTETLDEQIKQRTKELQEKINELEKFNKLVVGRELKMVELKKKIQNLNKDSEK